MIEKTKKKPRNILYFLRVVSIVEISAKLQNNSFKAVLVGSFYFILTNCNLKINRFVKTIIRTSI